VELCLLVYVDVFLLIDTAAVCALGAELPSMRLNIMLWSLWRE
jgi:hypothetical protein